MGDVQECWSIDEECFNADSLNELLDNHADEIVVGTVVYKGDAIQPDITKLVSADDIVELLSERAWDEYGEGTEGFPYVTGEEVAVLDRLLQGWIGKYCRNPVIYGVENVKEYVITEEDLS